MAAFTLAGGLYYEKSPRWSWLAEVSFWKDKGAANLQGESSTDQVRLMPIMIGSQYYFSQPATKTRFYVGATGVVDLVNVKSQYSFVAISDKATNRATEVKFEEDVSINGFLVTGGVKFRL